MSTAKLYNSAQSISIVKNICDWYDLNDNDHDSFYTYCDLLDDIEPKYNHTIELREEKQKLLEMLEECNNKLEEHECELDDLVSNAENIFKND